MTERVYCGFDDDKFNIETFGNYSRTSVARTHLGPWKLVRDRDSSSQ